MPVLLFDEAYWRRVIDFGFLAEEGVIDPRDLNLFRFVETAEAAWELIQRYYAEADAAAAATAAGKAP